MPQGRKVGELHRARRFARRGVVPGSLAPGLTFFSRVAGQPAQPDAAVTAARAAPGRACARAYGGLVDRAATRTGARGRKGDIGSNCTWGGLYDRLFHINSLAP